MPGLGPGSRLQPRWKRSRRARSRIRTREVVASTIQLDRRKAGIRWRGSGRAKSLKASASRPRTTYGSRCLIGNSRRAG